MTDPNAADETSLGVPELERLDQACSVFEQRWRAGQPPPLERFVDEVEPALRGPLLKLLLPLDIEFRHDGAESASRAGYVQLLGHHAQLLEQIWPEHQAGPPTPPDNAASTRPINQPATTADFPDRIRQFRIITQLGVGSFGTVYRGHDEQLQRDVALKVAHRHDLDQGVNEMQLHEARMAAQLDHPAIVPIFEIGRTEDGRQFIVSRFVDGSDLKHRLEHFSYEPAEAVALIATLGEALHHAHQHGLVHRDIKPANILIDQQHRPFLADFGLALHEDQRGTGARFAGSPAYMSPEQARQEGHLVDARSDVFSLTVVLYHLLTGQRPFRGDGHEELLRAIREQPPRPPSQLEPRIPAGLDRIVLKGLAKRASDRYPTAAALVDDLKAWLSDPLAIPAAPVDTADQLVVPRGLRAFDDRDTSFFLRLIPGPRDRQEIPESVTFWTSRIESRDASRSFRVGILYGPSGSGKSSFVQAGVIPQLDKSVVCCQVQATPDSTEVRLLAELQRLQPALTRCQTLVEAIRALRGDRAMSSENKLLIVIDQFEQWLSRQEDWQSCPLVAALRQCDGQRVSALLLVRDDYWAALTRCLQALEVALDADNSQLIAAFDTQHARRVLVEFGQAYGRLPAVSELEANQEDFLELAVREMASRGQIIPVRLVLLADVFRHRDWTRAELRQVGGVKGAMSKFLDQLVFGESADRRLQGYADATVKTLRALLPPAGTSIKGRPRSIVDLQELTDLDREEVQDVLATLASEYRLVTKSAPADSAQDAEVEYQLAHDYLVPIVRNWVAQRQRDTLRGRVANLLSERTAAWKATPQRRSLPSLVEWLAILLLSPRTSSLASRQMMWAASRLHVTRLTLASLAVFAITFGGTYLVQANRARELRDRLLAANTAEVPAIVAEIEESSGRILPMLQAASAQLGHGFDEQPPDREKQRQRVNLMTALVRSDPGRVGLLQKYLGVSDEPDVQPAVSPSDMAVVSQQLQPYLDSVVPSLWSRLESTTDRARQRRLASVLAQLDPAAAAWSGPLGQRTARALVAAPAFESSDWMQQLVGVRQQLAPYLLELFSAPLSETERENLGGIFASYAADDLYALCDALLIADNEQLGPLTSAISVHGSQGQAELHRRLAALDRPAVAATDFDVPAAETVATVERYLGSVGAGGAFAQTVPLSEAPELMQAMSAAGYRPISYRPYAFDDTIRVAVGWRRDGHTWRTEVDLSADDLLALHQAQPDDQELCDICYYVDGSQARFAATWVTREQPAQTELYLDETYESHDALKNDCRIRDFVPVRIFERPRADGVPLYSALWRDAAAPNSEAINPLFRYRKDFGNAWKSYLQVDCQLFPVDLGRRDLTDPTAQVLRADSLDDDKELKFHIYNLSLLGRFEQCLPLAEEAVDRIPADPITNRIYVKTLAALGKTERLNEALSRAEKAGVEKSSLVMLRIRAALGQRDTRTAKSELQILESMPTEAAQKKLLRAYALVAAAFEHSNLGESNRYRSLALQRLEDGPNSYLPSMLADDDFDALRSELDFQRGLDNLRIGTRYAAVWIDTHTLSESALVWELTPQQQLTAGREKLAQGWLPHCVSVRGASRVGTDVAASVWHYRLPPAETLVERASQRANLVLGLAVCGELALLDAVLQDQDSRQTQTYIVHRLGHTKLRPDVLIDRLNADSSAMQNRNLLLAAGSFPSAAWGEASPDKMSQYIATVRAVLANSADAGVRSAASWFLRRLKQPAEFTDQPAEGNWYVNSLGQQMIVLQPPPEIRIGSHSSEQGRVAADETLHQRKLERRFALCATEVTVAQFEEFLRSERAKGFYQRFSSSDTHGHDGSYTPSPDCPQIDVTFFDAVRFCQWLSEREGIPKEQWCYDGIWDAAEGQYRVSDDFFDRAGYRLPTEAEWEFACRANSTAAWHFGWSEELLGSYAWYADNANYTTHPVGTRIPNEWGLFDMLGNVREWCQDRFRKHWESDETEKDYLLSMTTKRALRNGGFGSFGRELRSASRVAGIPRAESRYFGFRVARTEPAVD